MLKIFSLIIIVISLSLPAQADFTSPKQEANYYFKRGQTKLKLQDWQGALEDFTQVIDLFPDNYKARNFRATAEVMLGKTNDALEDCELSLEINSKQKAIYLMRGMLYLVDDVPSIRRTDEFDIQFPLDDFSQVIKLSKPKGNFTASLNSGIIQYLLGDQEEALKDIAIAIKTNAISDLPYYNRALIEYNNGDLTSSLADINNAISLNVNGSSAYNNRGNIYYGQGDYSKALADYDKAIKIQNNCAAQYYNRANTKLLLEDFSGADSDLTRAETNRGLASSELIRITVSKAYVRLQLNDLVNGMSLTNTVISSSDIKPDNIADSYYNRGRIRYLKGSVTDAYVDFYTAVGLKPHNTYELYDNLKSDFIPTLEDNINLSLQFADLFTYKPIGGSSYASDIHCASVNNFMVGLR